MRVLGIDYSIGPCSVAISECGLRHICWSSDAPRSNGSPLVDVVRRVLFEAGDLNLVAVSVGPGSLAGIRTAIALASGLAQGAGIPVVGVSTADALSAGDLSRPLWLIMARPRGDLCLYRNGVSQILAAGDIPDPDRSREIILAGTAVDFVDSLWRAKGIVTKWRIIDRVDAFEVAIAGAGIAAELRSGKSLPLRDDINHTDQSDQLAGDAAKASSSSE